MSTHRTPLAAPTEARLQEMSSAEILVGIPRSNNADRVERVVQAVGVGLAKHVPSRRAILVNSDGGSSAGTPAIVARTPIDFQHFFIADQHSILHRIVMPYHGTPGKGSAFRTIFEIARRLTVRACAVVDADLRSMSPEWIELLLRPIMEEGSDDDAPYYLRHTYDGTITKSLTYPLMRALYGQRIRQPIGGEFGFSSALATHDLNHQVWETEVARFGIPIWMTTEAMAGGARVCQSFLGATIHNPKDPAADLPAILTQVMEALVALLEQHEGLWSRQEGSQPVSLFGFPNEVGVEPVHVNVEQMVSHDRQGLTDLEPIWRQILADDRFTQLCDLQGTSLAECHISDELRVQIVYDAAIAHRTRIIRRDHLLKALIPLYVGRTASFIHATQGLTSAEADRKIEALCHTFEHMKPSLVERWQPPVLRPVAPTLLHHTSTDTGGDYE